MNLAELSNAFKTLQAKWQQGDIQVVSKEAMQSALMAKNKVES